MRKLSRKQREIMLSLCEGLVDENGVRIGWKDIYQLLDSLTYDTTRDSMHFSIRALRKHGLVEKLARELREGKWVTILAPTSLAFDYFERVIQANDKVKTHVDLYREQEEELSDIVMIGFDD